MQALLLYDCPSLWHIFIFHWTLFFCLLEINEKEKSEEIGRMGIGNKRVKSAKEPVTLCASQIKNYILNWNMNGDIQNILFSPLTVFTFSSYSSNYKMLEYFLENIWNNLLDYMPLEIKCEFFNVHLRHLY